MLASMTHASQHTKRCTSVLLNRYKKSREPFATLGWEFRFGIPFPGTTGIRNSASEFGVPELSGGKANRKTWKPFKSKIGIPVVWCTPMWDKNDWIVTYVLIFTSFFCPASYFWRNFMRCDRFQKSIAQTFPAIIATPTKYHIVFLNSFRIVWYVIPLCY